MPSREGGGELSSSEQAGEGASAVPEEGRERRGRASAHIQQCRGGREADAAEQWAGSDGVVGGGGVHSDHGSLGWG